MTTHCEVDFQQNDSFMYPMNALSMDTLNKSVGAILDAKRGKLVKQPSTVSQVVGGQASSFAGTSVVG
ncbi:unnamed protein product [Ilex paraguariensis]|uniref:Uncharacterized protein n=1 Tax=Ilex paraguariensis TaxID=185542 RepID=A0ABC8S718_9AQUA